MKRIGDDLYAPGSHFRRPLISSYGQSSIHISGGIGGGSISNGGINSQKLTTDDALTYLKKVKEMFQDQRDKYDMFLEIMKDFKAQRTDTSGVIARVKELFKGHSNLILGFNTFLPKGFEITFEEEEAPPKKIVEFEEAITFVNKIKKRFQHDEHVYKSFLDILNMYRRENKDITEVYNGVSALFEEHSDLLEEFTRFLPDSLAPHSAAQLIRSQAQQYGDRGSNPSLVRRMLMEKDRGRERAVASRGDRDHSVDRSDLNDDKAMVRMHRKQMKRAEKYNRERRSGDLDDGEAEQDNLKHSSEKRKTSKRSEGCEAYSSPASHSEQKNIKSICNQAFVFCEKVKERLCSQDDYQTFLKCLNIFSNGIIQRNELQNLVSDLLGKFPDLMDEFNQFFDRCESIDGFQHLAGIMSKKSLSSEEHLSRSVKKEEKEREHKHDIKASKYKEHSMDKYMEKSIQELDLSDCERCTPSYRLLPSDYPIPAVRHRQKLGAAVLNDQWVSVTSGSEDYSFKHMRRNQYEESLFRCEDDRFELDILLESVSSAAKRAEELLNIITEKKLSFQGSFRIEDHFTALNLRCIERIYGDHGLDVTEIIRKNPAAALPVILTRLKQKQDEWTKCREDFNVVWADVYAKNHYNSLDHRSFYFKQQDSKNLSAKALVSEIRDLKEKSQKEDDVLLSISAGHRQSVIPQLEYEYLDRTIHEDLFNLVKYSCEEICSTKEQIGKVLRLWADFLELMLGVPTRANRQLKFAANVEEYALSGVSKHGEDGDPANKDVATCSAGKPHKDQEIGNGDRKRSEDVDERVATSSSAFPSGVENNNDIVGTGDSSGIGRTIVLENGVQSNASKANSNHDESGGPTKIEKEEGELLPTGDSEDNLVVYEDRDLKSTAKPEHSVEAEGENDDDDDASEAGLDASRTESIGEECSQDDNGVDGEGEHDEIDGKAESEGEAEGLESHLMEEDNGLLPLSECVLVSVKPLSKHVDAAVLLDDSKKDSRVFYGNDDFYVLCRLHQILYERISFAKTNCADGETKGRKSKDSSSVDPYARFMRALFNLLNGSAENSKFEDECRAIIGNQSYVLFTLEKLIYKLVKQLQAVVADDMDNKLLQLYAYEKSRNPGRVIDSVYYENARILLHEDNIYRLECSSSPPRLSIQLMDNIIDKPEAYAVSMDSTFASYLKNELLSISSGKKERHNIVLQRNIRRYTGLGDITLASKAMEGVEVINCLQCKMSCSTFKISYVLDTEDFFHRKKQKSNKLSQEKSSQKRKLDRIERFHKFLSTSR